MSPEHVHEMLATGDCSCGMRPANSAAAFAGHEAPEDWYLPGKPQAPLADDDRRTQRAPDEAHCEVNAVSPWCVLANGHEGECAGPRKALAVPYYRRRDAELAARAVAFFNPHFEGSVEKAMECVLQCVRGAANRDQSGAGYMGTGGVAAIMMPWTSEIEIKIEASLFERIVSKESAWSPPGAYDCLDPWSGAVLRDEKGNPPKPDVAATGESG